MKIDENRNGMSTLTLHSPLIKSGLKACPVRGKRNRRGMEMKMTHNCIYKKGIKILTRVRLGFYENDFLIHFLILIVIKTLLCAHVLWVTREWDMGDSEYHLKEYGSNVAL